MPFIVKLWNLLSCWKNKGTAEAILTVQKPPHLDAIRPLNGSDLVSAANLHLVSILLWKQKWLSDSAAGVWQGGKNEPRIVISAYSTQLD